VSRCADATALLAGFVAEGRLSPDDVARAEASAANGESAAHAAARLGLIEWDRMGRAAAEALGWRWVGAGEAETLGPPPEGGPAAAFQTARRVAVCASKGGPLALLPDPIDDAMRRALPLSV
jgi:hypothetical protein